MHVMQEHWAKKFRYDCNASKCLHIDHCKLPSVNACRYNCNALGNTLVQLWPATKL